MSEDFPAQLAGFRAGALVAGYRLEAQVGAGGMAVVFRARDERLGRLVALKILAPALTADAAFRRRFIAESRAAAAVDDPHIIPVYEAGEADGVLFIAMRFVQGGDLRLVLDREGALPPDRTAAFISPVASALDAAHRAGLVHRDVKPANILVDAREDRPDHVYLSDFGVSKGAMTSVSLTGTGQFLGTPDYSAPEQIQGWAVDGRADQYALACVAYQLLTGTVPFERDQGMAVLLAHLSEPPPSLSPRRPGLPGAADQVLARGMAKVPEKRYGSCRDFADALREALGLAPYHSRGSAAVLDHPHPGIALSQPGFSRSAAAGTGKAAVSADPAAVDTVDSVPGGPVAAADVPAAANIVTGPRTGADDGAGTVSTTAAAVAGEGIPAAAAMARAASPPTGNPAAVGESSKLAGELGEPAAQAGSPASAANILTAEQRARLDPGYGSDETQSARRPRRRIAHPLISISAMTVWIRHYRFLAIAVAAAVLAAAVVVPFVLGSSPSSRLADSPSSRPTGSPSYNPVGSPSYNPVGTLADLSSGYYLSAMAFSRPGVILAAPSDVGVNLWNIATRKLTATLTDPDSIGVSSVAFSPDGTTLAASEGNSAYLWNIAARKLIGTFANPNSNGVGSVAFSPSGTTLATGDDNSNSTDLWNIATRKLIVTLADPDSKGVDSVAFSPGGTLLATGDGNGSTYLWDIATRKLTATLTDPSSQGVGSVAFSPGGTLLATGDGNGSTYLWDIATRKLTATHADPDSKGVDSVAFSPGGTLLATGDGNGSTYLWDIATRKLTATLTDPSSQGVGSVAFSPGGTLLATGDENGNIYLWHRG